MAKTINPLIRLDEINNIQNIAKLAFSIFEPFSSYSLNELEQYLIDNLNPKISRQLLLDGKVIGFYLFQYKSLPQFLTTIPANNYLEFNSTLDELNRYNTLTGIEGVALGILPEYRSLGFGKLLLNYSDSLPKDYIWGQHLDKLNNLAYWLKKRRHIASFFSPEDQDIIHITASTL